MPAGNERSLRRAEKGDRGGDFSDARILPIPTTRPAAILAMSAKNAGSVQPGSRMPGGIGVRAPWASASIAPSDRQGVAIGRRRCRQRRSFSIGLRVAVNLAIVSSRSARVMRVERGIRRGRSHKRSFLPDRMEVRNGTASAGAALTGGRSAPKRSDGSSVNPAASQMSPRARS